MRTPPRSLLAWHHHDNETPVQRAAREEREWREAELADCGILFETDLPEVPAMDIFTGDHERDLGRHGK